MKKAISILLILLFCISFAACKGAEQSGEPTAKPTAEASASEEPADATEAASATEDPDRRYLTYEEVFDPETDFYNGYGTGYANIINTEDAYYISDPGGTFMYYYDKNTEERAVLCSKPECMHDSSGRNNECMGYLDAYTGNNINIHRGKIYYIHWEDYYRGYALCRIGLDGSGNERLCRIDGGGRYEPQHSFIHRGKLFGAQWFLYVKEAVLMGTWNVTCWDIETGSYKVICEEDAEGLWAEPSLFFFGNYVYICVSSCDSVTDMETGETTHGDRTIRVYRFDIETEELETLAYVVGMDYPFGAYTIAVPAENRVYVASINGGPVYLVEGGELKEAFNVEVKGKLQLFADKAVVAGFAQNVRGDLSECRLTYTVMDLEGNVLLSETVGFEAILELSEDLGSIGLGGVYADEDAIYISYGVSNLSDEEDPVTLSCIMRYELVDGELEETLIAVGQVGI